LKVLPQISLLLGIFVLGQETVLAEKPAGQPTIQRQQREIVAARANSRKRKSQYKKIHRLHPQSLAEGKYDEMIDLGKLLLELDADDAETHFFLALAYSLKGDMDSAISHVKASLTHGLDIARYYAGPRTLSKKLLASEAFQALPGAKGVVLVHGPMLGDLRKDCVKIWVRTAKPTDVAVHVGESTFEARSHRDDDFTAVIDVEGLRPGVRYQYNLEIDGQALELPYETAFTTLPEKLQRFTLAFGGGAGYTPHKERMWDVIARHKPQAMLLLGDNVYIDLPESPESQRYCYYRRQSRPEFRRLVTQTPVFAIWDDHDFGTNDCSGGPDKDRPEWKRPVLKIFTENWANPSYGGGQENPGCWFTARVGPIDFFFLDTRYYRHPGHSMLGPHQLAWLKQKLQRSTATFKIICSSVPLARGTKPGSKDTWDGFADEREEIFSLIDDKKISGVFTLAADRHRSDIRKIPRPNGYDTYEFMSSRLTNVHVHQVIKGAMFGYNEKCSFGLVSFDFTVENPTATYEIYSIDDEKIHSMTIALDQLGGPTR
jgi:alkaline phosphatase D